MVADLSSLFVYIASYICFIVHLDRHTALSAGGLDHTKFILKTLEEIDSGERTNHLKCSSSMERSYLHVLLHSHVYRPY